VKLKRLKQKLNYAKTITGHNLDYHTYNDKFRMWDFVIKNDLFIKQDHDALALLKDPTIYFYAFFRDEQGFPFKLTAYQDAICNCVHDHSKPVSPERFIIYKSANQIGKSCLLALMAIFHVMNKDNVNVVMVSKSLPQSQFLLATIRQLLNNSRFSDSWKEEVEQANTTTLTIIRQGGKVISRIICAPCGEGLLGYPVHYLYLDEADFYENAKTFFWKVAFPRTNKTKGQIIIFSNPNAEISRQSSLLWQLWSGDMFVRKFEFNFLDAPWNTQEEYEKAKKSSPSYIFASTHDGQFPEDGGGFFTRKELQDVFNNDWENTLPITDKQVYIGLDFAKVNDNTTMVIGTKRPNVDDPKLDDLEVRYVYEFPSKTDYDKIIDRLKQVVEYYNTNFVGVAAIGFDATGVGKAIEDMMLARGLSVIPIVFSLPNKNKMYANFKMLAEQRRIKIVKDEECEKQLAGLVFVRTRGDRMVKENVGTLTVRHATESMKDDFPDALCCLIDVSIFGCQDFGFSFVPYEDEGEGIR